MKLLKEKIIQSVLYSNAYIGHKEVLNLEELKTITYTLQNQEALIRILQSGEYEKIDAFEPAKDILGEDLTVIRFDDEKGNGYYGLYYDSILLHQNPQIIDIVEYKKA